MSHRPCSVLQLTPVWQLTSPVVAVSHPIQGPSSALRHRPKGHRRSFASGLAPVRDMVMRIRAWDQGKPTRLKLTGRMAARVTNLFAPGAYPMPCELLVRPSCLQHPCVAARGNELSCGCRSLVPHNRLGVSHRWQNDPLLEGIARLTEAAARKSCH